MKIDVITCSECKYFQSWGRKGEALARFGQAYSCSIGMLLDPKPDDYCVEAEKKEIKRYTPKTPCDLCAYTSEEVQDIIDGMPSVTPQQKMGRCKDCKYFEYDSVAEVHGIPLIIAHEICKRWGDGCQTKEDGYCFLFEPKMQEVEE